MFSPQKAQDFEDRIYYEIATTGNIVKNILGLGNTTLTHSPDSFEIEGGDVWWRRIPLNTAEFAEDDEDEGVDLYRNLIQDEDSVPRFKDFFVESMAFNDTFARNNVYFYGRPGIYLPNEKEIRRRASLTFSDKNNYATSISRFTSFNKSKLNFKDIPNEYGSINYLLNNYDSLFVVQEDKASAIPISRQILETALGQEQVTVSSQIVGTQRFFSGDYGTDNNPESVCKVGNDIYFAHKSNHQVYKFNPSSGIQVISNMGMNSFFVELFRSAEATEGKVRVVGGYDPLKDEFLITVYNQDESNVFNIEFVEQPIGIDLTVAPDIDDEVDEDDEDDLPVEVLFGCTNPSANNYNPFANVDDGSCIFPGDDLPLEEEVYGCMNPLADNYNPAATIDNGSCYVDYGCTDPSADNYNPLANTDNGTCVYSDSEQDADEA